MKTSIIPILKNRNGDTSDKNNYRAIAIVSAMSKLLELCLSKLLDEHLCTSENQFGFKKKKHATDLCIDTVKSVIKYYNYFNNLFLLISWTSLRCSTVLITGLCSRSYF